MAVSTPTNLRADALLQRQRQRLAAAAVILTALSLSACKPSRTDPPAPIANQSPMAGPVNNSAGDTSVPPAGTVLAPGAAIKPDTTTGRTNRSMSRAQESAAMPMPGQNNDHSAPLSTASSATTGKPANRASASTR